jgi:hypothetical protein
MNLGKAVVKTSTTVAKAKAKIKTDVEELTKADDARRVASAALPAAGNTYDAYYSAAGDAAATANAADLAYAAAITDADAAYAAVTRATVTLAAALITVRDS